MKNIKISNLLLITLMVLLWGCSTDFLEEKNELNGATTQVYLTESAANQYINGLYKQTLVPKDKDLTNYHYMAWLHGRDNLFGHASDEGVEENDINKVYSTISQANNHALKSIYNTSSENNIWSTIRYINEYLDNVDEYNSLSDDFVDKIKGQLLYFRGSLYFELLRLYGGVPLITTTRYDYSKLTPRSSSSEVLDQIIKDLDMAISLLPTESEWGASNYGKVSNLSAAALKGRVLLTWASPLFNRNDDQGRWQMAYDACKEAYDVCLAGGKGLNTDWKNMWFQEMGNPEAITIVGYNNHDDNDRKNNANERKSRSRDQGGDGAVSPTKNIMDAFPMADGTPYDPSGDLNDFYKNRDPRFYHTFAYNGSIWPYQQAPDWKNWTYSWAKTNENDVNANTESSTNRTGIYLKKFTNDEFEKDDAQRFRYNGADWMEFRFAEVVLNYAEAAIGVDNLAEGKSLIRQIRERAGIEMGTQDYGLASVSSRDQHFEAVINERKVEFAYENLRFFDLRRWMLYNDDFGTCTRLNQTPIQGIRRQGYTIVAKTDANTRYVGEDDPFKADSGVAPVIDRDAEATDYPAGVTTYEEYVDYLYDNHFEVVVRDDVDESGFEFTWYNEYYFFGIYEAALRKTSPTLEQTQGWNGGTFNPLQ